MRVLQKAVILAMLLSFGTALSAQNVIAAHILKIRDSLFLDKVRIDTFSKDGTFSAASDRKLPTSLAVKSYVDTHLGTRPLSTGAPSTGDVMKWNGSQWEPDTDGGGGGGSQTLDTFEIVSNDLRLSLSGDGEPFQSVSLAPYLDNTDGQKVDTFRVHTMHLEISLEGDNEPAVWVDIGEIAPIQTITAGDGIGVLPAGTDILIENTGDLSETNEIQSIDTFAIVSNILRLGLNLTGQPFQTVDLSPYLDNTDAQTLSLSGDTLSISGGNSVDLGAISGGDQNDSTFAKVGGGYSGKTITSDVYRTGKVVLGANGVTMQHRPELNGSGVELAVVGGAPVTNDPAVYITNAGSSSQAFHAVQFALDSTVCPAALPFSITGSYFPAASAAGDNTVFGFGWNRAPGGGKLVADQPGSGIFWEQQFSAAGGSATEFIMYHAPAFAPTWRQMYITAELNTGASSVMHLSSENIRLFDGPAANQMATFGLGATALYGSASSPVVLEMSPDTGQASILRMKTLSGTTYNTLYTATELGGPAAGAEYTALGGGYPVGIQGQALYFPAHKPFILSNNGLFGDTINVGSDGVTGKPWTATNTLRINHDLGGGLLLNMTSDTGQWRLGAGIPSSLPGTLLFTRNNLLSQTQMSLTTGGAMGLGINPSSVVAQIQTDGFTTKPSAKFGSMEIQSNSTTSGWMANNGYFNGTNFLRRSTGGVGWLNFTTNGTIQFIVAPSGSAGSNFNSDFVSRMTMDSVGRIGMGTSAPTQKLDVVGGVRLRNGLYDSNNSLGTSGQILSTTGTATDWIDAPSGGAASEPAQQVVVGTGAGIDSYDSYKYNSTDQYLYVLSSNSSTADRGILSSQHSTSIHGALIRFRKSRGTPSSPTTTVNGDITGIFSTQNHDGTSYISDAATFGFGVSAAVTTGSVPTSVYIGAGSAAADGYTSDLLVHHGGNVGIGSFGSVTGGFTAPSARLHTKGSGSTSSTTALLVENSSGTDALVVLDNTRVGIATTTPAVSLDMSGATDAARLPNGTTAQRPTAAAGQIRYNSTVGGLEVRDASKWIRLTSSLTPGIAAGAAAGTGPTISVTGNDLAGSISLTTGTGTTTGTLATVTFNQAFDGSAQITVQLDGTSDAAITQALRYGVGSAGNTSFVVTAPTALDASTSYVFTYTIHQ